MSETQARWFAELVKPRTRIRLPSEESMVNSIVAEHRESAARYTSSARHTIQKDPVTYCDDIAAKFGAKPQMWRHPTLILHLLLSSCGTAQYRLQGPGKVTQPTQHG